MVEVATVWRFQPIPPPVAKLDIAVDSDSKGRGFESLRAGHVKTSFVYLTKEVFYNDIRSLRNG